MENVVGSVFYILSAYAIVSVAQTIEIESLLTRIVVERFPTCSVVLTFDRDDSAYAASVHAIQENLTALHERDTYLINFMTFEIPNGIFPSKLGSVSKLRANCVVSLIFISEVQLTTFRQLYRLLIPHNYEVSKKDEDYYFMVSSRKDAARILLSEQFSMKLKYKLLAFTDLDNGTVHLSTVCFYCNKGRFGKQAVVGLNLDLEEGRIPSRTELFPDQVRNFNGQHLRVVVATGTHQQARIRPDPNRPGKYIVWRGSYFYVLDHLQGIFNFTYTVRPSTGGGTGLQFPNGTWVGTTGDVYNGAADIGMVTAVTYQRYRFVSYSYSLSWEWLTFATAIPSPHFTWEAIFWPFSPVLWAYLLASMLLLIACMSAFGRLLLRIGGKRRHWTAAEFIFGTFLEQSFELPERVTLRLITTIWLVFSVVMGTGYRSKLVTALAFPVTNTPPDTFKALADSGYKVGLCYVGGAAYSVFKSSTNPTYVKLANTMELFTDMTDCFVSTLGGNRGCIGYDSMANYVMAKNLTDRRGRKLVVVTPEASTFFVACGFVLTKRAVFRLNFDQYIMTWDDMALITKWRQMDFESVRKARVRWEDENGIEGVSAGFSEGPAILALGNLKAIFFLHITGLIIATVAFFVEHTKVKADQLRTKVQIKIKSRANTIEVDVE